VLQTGIYKNKTHAKTKIKIKTRNKNSKWIKEGELNYPINCEK